MKNKLIVEFVASDKFVGDSPVNAVEQQPQSSDPREPAPKIVVCPPMEEITGPTSAPRSAPRGTRLLRSLGRRLARRSADDDSQDSSSSDSGSDQRTADRSSCSASDSGSDGSERQRRHRSTVSLRRVFQSLNLTVRSSSSSPTERPSRTKKQQQPKRILRPPVSYTYVRGLSGLPTQRVPRHTVFCAPSGLNR